MPIWHVMLEINFKEPVDIRTRRRFFLPGKFEKVAGFYQNYGITQQTLEAAKDVLTQRVIERYPEWRDNMDITFDEVSIWGLAQARERLATDLRKFAKGDPAVDGIWMEMGRLFYPPSTEQ